MYAIKIASLLSAGEISKEDYDQWRYRYISKEDYDQWRYRYPEFDKAQTYVKAPPQDLF